MGLLNTQTLCVRLQQKCRRWFQMYPGCDIAAGNACRNHPPPRTVSWQPRAGDEIDSARFPGPQSLSSTTLLSRLNIACSVHTYKVYYIVWRQNKLVVTVIEHSTRLKGRNSTIKSCALTYLLGASSVQLRQKILYNDILMPEGVELPNEIWLEKRGGGGGLKHN